MNNNPIGIFDSGAGGITIYNELYKLLPREQFVYKADGKNAPYGIRTEKEILKLSVQNTEFLLSHDCKCIVVACNTATTQAIDHLRRKFQIPFIGVEPAVKPAALESENGKIGILATEGTLRSSLFSQTYNTYGTDLESVIQVGSGIVELIEQGKSHSEEMYRLLERYLSPMIEKKVTGIVLGCTHYPLLKPMINKITGGEIKIYDPAHAVAQQTRKILESENLLSQRNDKVDDLFYSNSGCEVISRVMADLGISKSYGCKDVED